jgi:hypothetical protein
MLQVLDKAVHVCIVVGLLKRESLTMYDSRTRSHGT